MKITKIGHCCLLVEVGGKRILTDPGSFTVDDLITQNIDIVLITHEHQDHLHIPSLQKIVVQSPSVQVISNTAVGKLLTEADIALTVLEGNESLECAGITLQACDGKHAEIYEEIGQVQNTGYFIADTLFYPGDSYAEPGRSVDILAFPIGGPWCKISDTIRYVLKIKPKYAFPVHDGIERLDRVGILHFAPTKILTENGIDFRPMKAGDTEEFQSVLIAI
jgi:L-ascorbate metabolism protein UlaG (beta-lactamase superfamily)